MLAGPGERVRAGWSELGRGMRGELGGSRGRPGWGAGRRERKEEKGWAA